VETSPSVESSEMLVGRTEILPCSVEYQRGLAMRMVSACLCDGLSNVWIVTKRKKDLSRFL